MMEYSFLAARLSFTFDVHMYIFHGKIRQINSAAAAASEQLLCRHHGEFETSPFSTVIFAILILRHSLSVSQ